MHSIAHQFRYAIRQLSNSPGFAIVSVLTLALGIGANIAVFSVTNAVLLNPSGIPHAGNLVALRAHYDIPPDLANISMSPPDFADAAEGKEIFSAAAIMTAHSFNFSRENANPDLMMGARVSSGYFDVFEVRPTLGRIFTPEEDQPGAGLVAVLSHQAWQKRFAADPNILGRSIILDQRTYRIIGVMGPEFNWPNQAELWVPIALPPARYHDHDYRYNEYLFGVARLRPGVTLQQANTYLKRKAQENIASEGSNSYGRISGWGIFSMPLTEFIGGNLRKPLLMLLAAVGMVLLIACANRLGSPCCAGCITMDDHSSGTCRKHRAYGCRPWPGISRRVCGGPTVAARPASLIGRAPASLVRRTGLALRSYRRRSVFPALWSCACLASHTAWLVQCSA